jgi:hypothetical protein
MCRRHGSDRLDPEQRAAHCCALADYDTNQWTASDIRHVHMGAPSNYEAEGVDSAWQHPPENVEDDGCPGSWYRCQFIQSLLPYRRLQDGNGGRINHHAYNDVTDPFVKTCLFELELEESAAESMRLRVINS